MKVNFAVVVAAFFFVNECGIASSQLSALSYAGAEVGSKLIRSPTTTTATPTTKKSSFFGGIRNLFSRKDATTVSPQDLDISSSTPSSSSFVPTAVPPKSNTVALPPATPKPIVNIAPTSTIGASISPATGTSTSPAAPTPTPSTRKPLHDFESSATLILSTPKPPKVKEDFPALPPSRHGPTSGPASPTAIPNAWSNLPSQKTTPSPTWSSMLPTTSTVASMVNFVPRDPNQPTPATLGSFTSTTVSPDVTTNEELETISEALFAKESVATSTLLTVKYQGRTQSAAITDEAPEPLFSLNEVTLNAIPTVAKMRALYNNYEKDTTVNEYVTAMERNEENEFVDSLLSTAVMRFAMQFLQQKGIVTLDPKSHRDLLKTIWFSLYSRGRGKIGSSAFEHVFVTELKNGTVSGFHNWIYYFYEEQAGNADYKGWLKKIDLGTKGAIMKYRFSYNGIMKPVNSMFVGTSPELEMALYTVCFAVRADKECPVMLGGNKVIIRTHTFRYRGKKLIGSAFPEI